VANDFASDVHSLDGLELCFRNGWLQADIFYDADQGDIVAYVFSSSIHRWYCMLLVVPFQARNILDFVISKFSIKRLALVEFSDHRNLIIKTNFTYFVQTAQSLPSLNLE